MIEWFSAVSSAVAAGVVIWQFQRAARFKDDILRRFNELEIKLAQHFVDDATCRETRQECREYLVKTVREPLCRKIEEIKAERKEAWDRHALLRGELSNQISKHTHTGLPEASKVILP